MCGILALAGPRGTLPDDAACRAALGLMAHRGPDGEGLHRWTVGDTEIVLGHRRLALVGIADGCQPLVSERAAAVVNGEFYGYQAIRRRLKARGARFSTGSDSEILPRLYDAAPGARPCGAPGTWLDELAGEWCFVMADRGDATLWAACDPWGTKPLRWWRSPDGRTLMMASEAKTLFALGVPRLLDEEALRAAMAFQYLPYGRTLFQGVGQLPPGTWMKFADGKLSSGPTWNHFVQSPIRGAADPGMTGASQFPWLSRAEHDAAEDAVRTGASRSVQARALRLLVEGAVARRLPQESPFATHLSGGIDSAIVTALASRMTGQSIEGFCAGFPWAAVGDETGAATRSAQAIGCTLRPVTISPGALLEAMDEAPWHSEGLSNNLHAGAKILVSAAVRDSGYRIALTGEGADEAFLGYEHFRYDIPVADRPVTADVNPLSAGIMRPDREPLADASGLASMLGGIPAWVSVKLAAADTLGSLLGPRLRGLAFDPMSLVADIPDDARQGMAGADRVAQARALWSVYAMGGYILRGLDDAMGMSRSVESRLAFLDPSIQWLAARIAATNHYGADSIEKGLLREAVADLLPADILSRPKRAFLAPSPLGTPEGQAWARERLLGGPLAGSDLVTVDGMGRLLAQPQTPVRDGAIFTLQSLDGVLGVFGLD